ncbi:hypothetical protein [Embleya sp. NPDC005971]|uniref:hypothetical protein n=1 Tax=Embleya sp. NPDC005971 TaxID=3156724 RepID=UPI0033FF5C12
MKLFRIRRRLAVAEQVIHNLLAERRACLHLLADANTRIGLLEAENAAVTTENNQLKHRNAGLDTALRDRARRLDIVEAACSGLSREREALAADVAAGIERIQELEGQVTRLVRPGRHRSTDRPRLTIPGELVLPEAVAS